MIQDTHIPDYENRLPAQDTTDEIDLMDILRQLWLKRGFILKVTGIFLLLGLFIALFSPVQYTAHCTVVPQTGKNSSTGNLGGLAAMMGVNIGTGGSGETLSPSVYPQIVKSLLFTREIMQTPIKVEKSGEEEITLYDFYTNKTYQPFNLIGNIKKYTIGLPGVLVGAIRGNRSQADNQTPANDSTSLPILGKKEERVYKTIQSSIQLNMNSKEGYIEMNYTFPEAEAAARITDQVRKTLEQYVTAFKSEKVEDNLVFVQQSFNDARHDFLEKQEKLATFQDANRGLTTASARATEQRLRSEYDIAFTVYNELAKQLEQAKLTVKESKPVLTVIEPVVVPAQKSAPRRSMILVVFTFLGVVISIGWVFIKPFFVEIARGVKQNKEAISQ
ncbi:MAG: Wzz/FepE/Etk N-terminal domain-containing protein [Proteiniphilum sp.]|uniref:Wzz/FepE/Etk N-terminal domain-containing protein n=1 Tax=Proteiniphilum sp. TaxID=1926877 RepID=UPI002B21B00B|nr:Wzz/FepE/Etk N-terminal domain-containing protein [Proteiniphilum sp.]MEA5127261.1 Wzz/FepE/Etk N-terminal domain-containing protein [Proteiniphilum sp.]